MFLVGNSRRLYALTCLFVMHPALIAYRRLVTNIWLFFFTFFYVFICVLWLINLRGEFSSLYFLAPLTLMHFVLCLWRWASTRSKVPRSFCLWEISASVLCWVRGRLSWYIELRYLGSSSMEIGCVPEIWYSFDYLWFIRACWSFFSLAVIIALRWCWIAVVIVYGYWVFIYLISTSSKNHFFQGIRKINYL
jgi:hypothetical protein